MDSPYATKLGMWHLCVPHLAQGSFLPKKSNIANAEI
jgi:hypothetical protein